MILKWDIDPEIIRLFDIVPIRYYSLLFLAGLFAGLFVVKKLWIKEGWPINELDKLAAYVFTATIIGARLGHCLFYEPQYYLSHPLEMLLPFSIENGDFEFTGYQGLASHGGILAVFISIYIFSLKSKLDLFSIFDKVAVGGLLTGAFIRIGNFMNSEIIGKATNSIYGIVFKKVDSIPRHPSQLYEAIAYLMIFCILFIVYRKLKNRKPGFVLGLFFTLLFTARFIIEFSKINQVDFEDGMMLNMGQMLSIPFIMLGVIIMVVKFKSVEVNNSTFA